MVCYNKKRKRKSDMREPYCARQMDYILQPQAHPPSTILSKPSGDAETTSFPATTNLFNQQMILGESARMSIDDGLSKCPYSERYRTDIKRSDSVLWQPCGNPLLDAHSREGHRGVSSEAELN